MPDTNFVGNFNDVSKTETFQAPCHFSSTKLFFSPQLIRHRYNIRDYTEAQQRVDWFTDRVMISSFKQLITYFLNRINTYNGIRIGDDQTVLAFETGNEMNWGYGNWTTRMSHISAFLNRPMLAPLNSSIPTPMPLQSKDPPRQTSVQPLA